jgi:hypothetical protein
VASKSRKLQVEIVGDAKSLERAFGKSQKSSSKLGRAFGGVGKAALKAAKYAGVAAVAFAGAFAAIGIKGLIADEKAINKIESALKSTGGAAKVSSKELQKHAGALQSLTGVGADSIMTQQSILLSFTKVRNEVGKGNDVFKRGTESILDMSIALDQDMKSATVMVGKALNDPIKGLTAMGRAGIQFTEQQKDQIAALVESGNTLGAQKIILKELETQFGGTAKAMGETFGGKVERTKRAFEEVAKSVMRGLMPMLHSLGTWLLNTGIPAISSFASATQEKFRQWWPTIKAAFDNVVAAATVTFNWINVNVVPMVQEFIVAVQSIIKKLQQYWDKFGADLIKITVATFKTIWAVAKPLLEGLRATVRFVMALLSGEWGKAWDQLKIMAMAPIRAVTGFIKTSLTNLVPAVAGLALTVGKTLASSLANGIKSIALNIGGWVDDKILAPIRNAAGRIGTAAKGIGSAIKDGVREGATGILKAVGNIFVGFIRGVLRVLGKIPIIGGKIPKPESIPEFAKGGFVQKATLAVVGEDGPEAVIPLGSKRRSRGVELLSQAAAMMGLPGDYPGISKLADGGIFGPKTAAMQANAWAATQVAMLKGAQNGNILDDLKQLAARGAAAVIDKLPLVPPGLPSEISSLAQGVKDAIVTGIREIFNRKDEWNPNDIWQAFRWAMSKMGNAYLWGGGHAGWDFGRSNFDCSGFASHAAKKAGSTIGSPGTTSTTIGWARTGTGGNHPFLWGWRGMGGGARTQHMGAKILGSWFQFGNPGRRGGSDSQWNTLGIPPGLPGYGNGTSYVPNTGPAILHRGEMVVPEPAASAARSGSNGPLVNVERMIVQDATDIDRFASRMGRQLAMRVPA